MGGQKTVSAIFSEAVKQLKENYFQHVGASGIYTAAYFVFSSLIYLYAIVLYFAFLFGIMSIIPLSMDINESFDGYGVSSPWCGLTAVLIVLAVLFAVLFVGILVSMVFTIATNTVQAGVQKSVLMLVKGDKLTWQAVWDNFKKNWKRYLGISAWSCLWTTLWSLLFVIPGYVKLFSYSLAPYLVIENPNMTVRQALRKSMEITDGHKGKLFLIYLIQLGFMMMAAFLSNFGLVFAQYAAMIIWVYPLFYAMLTIAYVDIKQAAVEKGLLPCSPLPPAEAVTPAAD